MNPMAILPDTNHFLTVVVNSTHAVFYKNVDLVGVAPIPRPLTDCLNPEGVLLGDNNMELGQLRFYPRALSAASVKEIYKYGATLADISTGAKAYDVVATGLPAVRTSLEGSISRVQSGVASVQNDAEILQIASSVVDCTTGVARATPNNDAPDYSGAASVTYDLTNQDNKGGVATPPNSDDRAYYKIFQGPNKISSKITYTNIPNTTGRGFTMSFWYKHVACDVKVCEVCVFAELKAVEMCVQEEGVVLRGAQCSIPTGFFSFDKLNMPKRYFFGASKDKFWRHMAVQIDETSNKIRFFLDGAQAIESPFNLCKGITRVAQVDMGDGSARKLSISGKSKVPPVKAAVADVRMYLHSDDANADGKADGPLTAAHIYKIARTEAPDALSAKCLPYTSKELLDSNSFKDHLGHDCLVYPCWDVRFCTCFAFDSAAKLSGLGQFLN